MTIDFNNGYIASASIENYFFLFEDDVKEITDENLELTLKYID